MEGIGARAEAVEIGGQETVELEAERLAAGLLAEAAGEETRSQQVGIADRFTGLAPEAMAEINAPLNAPAGLCCLQHRDGQPLPGVQLYAGPAAAGRTSDETGWLPLDSAALPAGRRAVLWKRGWIPVPLDLSRPLPEAVRFEPADASLSLRLSPMQPDWKVERVLLQPLARPSSGSGPWDAVFTRQAFDRLSAGSLAPGDYDLHVWIRPPGAAPHPLGPWRVALAAGERTEIRIDPRTPADPEPDS